MQRLFPKCITVVAMSNLTITLLLPVSGIIVTAILVAASRKRRAARQDQDASEDLSWINDIRPADVGLAKGKNGNKKAGSKKAASKKTGSKNNNNSKTTPVPEQPAIETSCSSEEETEDEHDDIQLLAALQKNSSSKTPAAQTTTTKKSLTQLKNDSKVEIVEEDSPMEEGEGWSKVPTKDELVISSLRSRIESLAQSLQTSEAEKGTAEKALVQAQEKLARLEAELKERTQNFQLRTVSLEAEIESQRQTSQILLKRMSEMEENDLAEAKEEIDRLTEEIGKIEKNSVKVSNERDSLAGELCETQGKLSACLEEIAQLKQDIESFIALKQKYGSVEAELSKVKKALFETESSLINLKSQEASRSAEFKHAIEKKEQENSELARKVEMKETLVNSLEDQIKSLESDLQSFKQSCADLEREKEALVCDKESFEKEVLALNQKIEDISSHYESQIEKDNTLMDSYESESDKLKFEIYAKTVINGTLESKNAELQKRVEELSSLSESNAAELETLREHQKAYNADKLESVEGELKLVKQKFADYLHQNAGMKTRYELLVAENNKLAVELSSYKAAIMPAAFKAATMASSSTKGTKPAPVKEVSTDVESVQASPEKANR